MCVRDFLFFTPANFKVALEISRGKLEKRQRLTLMVSLNLA